ncbi:MAG: hypothetical protein KatS3mg057_3100 [Herpetosiphonaceae bacterium]|nr:MAG: hypothetical protein KatS3mg057_3100 [Herpetosiphonaceae bacterium]
MTDRERASEEHPEQMNTAQDQQPGETQRADPEQKGHAVKKPRPDTAVRAVQPDARVEMERGDDTFDEPSFSKGENYPTTNQTGLPYTVEQREEFLREAPESIFPDSPGGNVGAAPIAAEREPFLRHMMEIGHFISAEEAARWARAVFDALRERANDVSTLRATVFDSVVRAGEAPEVQVETMMWGQGFPERFAWLMQHLEGWSRQELYGNVAAYAQTTPDDPWVEAAVYSFFGALKRVLGDRAGSAVGPLGEMQPIWDRL